MKTLEDFKVGDRVRTLGTYNKYWGDGTVTQVGIYVLVRSDRNNGAEGGFKPEELELLSSPNSELEELVRRANDGEAAFRTLREKFLGKVEFRRERNGAFWRDVVSTTDSIEYRVKPAPAFDSFETSNGILVKPAPNDCIAVGCQVFGMQEAKSILNNFLSNNSNEVETNGRKFRATRKGICLEGEGTILPWGDAGTILEVLCKMGVKP